MKILSQSQHDKSSRLCFEAKMLSASMLCFAPLSLRIRVSLAFSAAQSITRRLRVAERGPGLTHSSSVEVVARAPAIIKVLNTSHGEAALSLYAMCAIIKKGRRSKRKCYYPKIKVLRLNMAHKRARGESGECTWVADAAYM
jgi:hypothetical protein